MIVKNLGLKFYKFKRLIRDILYKYFVKTDKGYKQLTEQKMSKFSKLEIIAICKNYVASPADFEKLIIKEIYPEIFEITSNEN